MGASSLLRGSHRAAALAQPGPWLCEPVTSAPPGPALLKAGSSKVRAASHPSGKLKIGSFTGIPAGRIEAQKGWCPSARSCMAGRYIWLSRLGLGQGGLHLQIHWHLRDQAPKPLQALLLASSFALHFYWSSKALWKRQRKESQKQSLELPRKSPMNTNVNHFRHTIYSKYSAHYFCNIALYPLHFSTCGSAGGQPCHCFLLGALPLAASPAAAPC